MHTVYKPPQSIDSIKKSVIEKCYEELCQYDIVKVNDSMIFIFTPSQVFVATPLQLFMIKHSHRNYIKRLRDIKDMLAQNSIKNMADLVSYNGLKPGSNNSQFDGLELIRMDLAWVK